MITNYYTPYIEDIRVGYECEVFSCKSLEITNTFDSGEFWIKKIIKNKGIVSWVEELVNSKRIRTPYLTKEQIEKEGWMWELEYSNDKNFYKGELSLRLYIGYVQDEIINFDISIYNAEGTLFKGECKSINEFRWICKLLKI